MNASHWAPDQPSCLSAALARVRELAGSGGRPIVILDLDDTLLSTTRRHARILREFSSDDGVAARWPEAAARLAVLEPPASTYSVTDAVRDAAIGDDEFRRQLRGFWFERFFRSEYVLEDEAIPGAPAFCRELVDAGAIMAYVTGRDEAMRPGTEISLRQKGFPVPGHGDARLVLKSRFDIPDFDFKREALERVAEWGPVAAGFENEPLHINLFADRFPAGRMVLVESRHSGRPIVPHATVGRIRDFLRTS